jgi:3-hydroxyisobutyrate dehydrogenase-like beta-hydroxyacid dehydrogenase
MANRIESGSRGFQARVALSFPALRVASSGKPKGSGADVMKFGIIGLGRMGSALARRYAAQGADVATWTRSGGVLDGIPSRPDLPALVARSDVLLSSLFDDVAVSAVLDQILDCDLAGKLIIETSTVTPSCLTTRIDALTAGGAEAVDAPISGGPELVEAGKCGLFIGGTDQAADRAMTALEPLTERKFHVGPLGTGVVMKTINNGIAQSYFAGLVEVLRLAKRAGLPLETVLRILGTGPAGLPMITGRIPKILGHDPEIGFTVEALHKDNAVFQKVAAEFDVDTPTLRAAEAMEREALADGLARADPASIFAAAYRDA